MRIGFIGVGGIAGMHMRHLARMEDVELSLFYDVNAERADTVAQQHGGRACGSVPELLDGAPDAVYVCVPPFAHGEAELAVLERGVPLFVEKPLAIEAEPAQRILQEVRKRGALTAVGYHWRYSEAADRAAAALAGKRPGMATGRWLGGMPEVSWWRRMDQSGGQLLEQTTHIFDLARYLLGEIAEVHAVYAQRELPDVYDGVTVPDVGCVNIRFAGGAVGTIVNTCLLDHGGSAGLDVFTREVTLEVRGDSLTERRRNETRTFRNAADPYRVEDETFVAAVRSGDGSRIRSPYEDAYRTHLVTVAANESAQTGRPVAL